MKKIKLSRETLRTLDTADAGNVHGGRAAGGGGGGGLIFVSLADPTYCWVASEVTACPSDLLTGCGLTIIILW